jgi:hypothetical protein
MDEGFSYRIASLKKQNSGLSDVDEEKDVMNHTLVIKVE